ncbi:hypothetical protein BDZ45DRAFT_731496 [Acephala macrosclerotiorum]|nr:hypothetical protein BDZ45DRAFT_731496 [Acephala macrosclerotiorum]
MDLKPLYEPKAQKPLSQAIKGFRDGYTNIHPLLTTQGHTRIRANFTIADWLLMGSLLQAIVIISTSLPVIYVLVPTFGLAIFKLTRLVLKIYRVVENPQMQNVRLGRQTALFPPKNGTMIRQAGEPVGGEGMCIVLLTNKCNHPLGLFYPTYRTVSAHARAMYRDLETHAEEYGFLGYSDYNANDVTKQGNLLSVMYFRSVEHVQKWAHGKVHREGWEWWNGIQGTGKTDCITIGHEIYSVPAGNWENIYVNSKPYDFGATQHAIKTAGVERKWLCPLMDANKTLKNHSQRMGNVKGGNGSWLWSREGSA